MTHNLIVLCTVALLIVAVVLLAELIHRSGKK